MREEEEVNRNTPLDNMQVITGAMGKQFGGGFSKMPKEYREMLEWCESEKKKLKIN